MSTEESTILEDMKHNAVEIGNPPRILLIRKTKDKTKVENADAFAPEEIELIMMNAIADTHTEPAIPGEKHLEIEVYDTPVDVGKGRTGHIKVVRNEFRLPFEYIGITRRVSDWAKAKITPVE